MDDILSLSFRDLLAKLEITQAEINRRWHIPLRTMSHWMNGDRQCPEYVKRMLIELIKGQE